MKLLLDENLPKRLKLDFKNHLVLFNTCPNELDDVQLPTSRKLKTTNSHEKLYFICRYFIVDWSINRPTETLLEYRVLFIWDGAEIYWITQ